MRPLTVEDLAEQAGMSSRHFARAFIAETGTTPSKAVERCGSRWRGSACNPPARRSNASHNPPAFRDPERMRRAFIPRLSASRRNRCAARRGRGEARGCLSAEIQTSFCPAAVYFFDRSRFCRSRDV